MAHPKRLLALEIRTYRFGFAVLEGRANLLDWGLRSFGEQKNQVLSTVADRVGSLIAFYEPFAVVVRARKYHSARHDNSFAAVARQVRSVARRSSVGFFMISARKVHDHFGPLGHHTKHDVAACLANQFEELSWKLPRRRKSYQSEPPALLVFDALANGITFTREHDYLPSTVEGAN